MPRTVKKLQRAALVLDRFDGGLNLRDAPSQLGSNETPLGLNISLGERGGFGSRLGYAVLNPGSQLPQPPAYVYESKVAAALLAYISTDAGVGKLYKSTDGGVTWSSAYALFTAGADAAIVDFKDRVVVVNTLDGVYSFPAALGAPTHTAGGTNNMDLVRGSAIAVWQNKLWVTGDPREDATHSKARVSWCNAGDELTWTIASDFIDIRDVDTMPCVAIGAGQGMDVTGKPSLLVYKNRSTYRINDSGSGAYTTLHTGGAGAASNRAVATALGRICSVNQEGVWVTDGLGVPVRVSDKVDPLFTPSGLDFSTINRWSAAPYRDRIIFSVTRAGASGNDLLVEYHPALGWLICHEVAAGAMAAYTAAGSADVVAGAVSGGNFLRLFSGGTDGANPVSARYQTPWVVVSNGDEARLRNLRVFGRGTVTCKVRTDFAAEGDSFDLDMDTNTGFVWGTGVWGTGTWGEPSIEATADEPLDEVCKAVSLEFTASTTASTFAQAMLGGTQSIPVGAWAVYGIEVDMVPLGT